MSNPKTRTTTPYRLASPLTRIAAAALTAALIRMHSATHEGCN